MRAAIIGCGLIGGSLGMALRRLDEVEEVVGFDADPEVARRAVERGAIDRAMHSLVDAASSADVIFVAAPVTSIPSIVEELAPALKAGAIVTDVGSTKARVVDEVQHLLGANGTFIGGHPMAGAEDDGIEGARPDLFQDAWWILTPTEAVGPEAYRRLHGLLSSIGCQMLALEPPLHDELMAIISHLPHLTAATLMNMAADHGKERASLLSLAAGGFRDVTRVAASNPTIWIDICRENRDAIGRALQEFAERLLDLRILIDEQRLDDLRGRLSDARRARKSLGGKPTEGTIVEILVPIPDRPGVLSEITTLVGNMGVNIEDLGITHAEEGGHGTLRLLIAGEDTATKVQRALETKGYAPRSMSI